MEAGSMGFHDNLIDATHRQIRDTAKRFALDAIAPHADAWEEAGEFPRDLYPRAAAAGILGVGFPEAVGGSGGGPMACVMAIEGLMAGRSTGVAVGLGSAGIAMPALVQAGDAAQIDRFVRPVMAGEKIRPSPSPARHGQRCRGGLDTRGAHGDDYVVTGAKMFITSGVRADFLTTLVRTAPTPTAA
ncbi:MAG: acyl-CoA dehydrogenase family protein [Myxococcota bacterium]